MLRRMQGYFLSTKSIVKRGSFCSEATPHEAQITDAVASLSTAQNYSPFNLKAE